ncbi:MAG: metal-dependent transcriptional regulator [Candidatus Hinthialibacter antarcticus]|nr:metal-dependent transcriptional regulator [Candidatus Hinthialibacter antarcticus]
MLGTNGEDYLKTVYALGLDGSPVTPSMLAEHFSVSPAAVTKMVKRLRSLKLVNYSRPNGLSLTSEGRKIALEILRHHRLIELYLLKALGYRWDQVHEEAERLEHVISEVFEEKIDEYLGHPTHDPHGDPIPGKDGSLPDHPTLPIKAMQPGDVSQVERVTDSDAEMLQYMDEVGLVPGAKVKMLREEPYGGSIHLKINGDECAIGRELASNVFVASKKKQRSSQS